MGAIYYKGQKYGAMPASAANLPYEAGSQDSTKDKIDANALGVSTNAAAIAALENYSTSETAIGKWIDGKTIYQKVIPANFTASNTWHNVETITGITRIISAEFLITEGGNRSNGIRQGLFAEISTITPYLVQIFNNSGYDIQVDYVILKYIKS